jgi:hypothetical protein
LHTHAPADGRVGAQQLQLTLTDAHIGKAGGRVEITDLHSGYEVSPELPPEGDQQQVLQLMVPGAVMHRVVRLRALTPGVVF